MTVDSLGLTICWNYTRDLGDEIIVPTLWWLISGSRGWCGFYRPQCPRFRGAWAWLLASY